MSHKKITKTQIAEFWSNPGIINQEFDEKTVNNCKPVLDDIAYKVLSGQSTLEQEEEKLLAQWENNH
ncbi:hypothetical protein [Acinetobacter nosocomialis]|uniref:hypothetical protein n=1 Tax=Acinetobacter nosocomialis TaxID=106654 RepID=UPI000707C2B6|nr:hypothetical protein [Acinetobacter nosocomialis]KQE33784.1 hypothetical protein APD42_07640 [Acinetobacter nosocomialis]